MSRNHKNLEKNLVDVIKEQQAKLGYRKEEIRLYYPLSSLRHILETQADIEEMCLILQEFCAFVRERLGNVRISNEGERFCFYIPKEGTEYVHEHMAENEFICELIALVSKHGCTLESVKEFFLQKSNQVVIKPVCNGEFDLLIYFTHNKDDAYYYCFKEEGAHMIYHRFLPQDYEDFGFL